MRVLLIDIDSLRPDHLGCYGYSRETSPTIDAVAADGVRFERCYVSDSPCLPSRTALATGRHGTRSGVVTHWGSGQWLDLYDRPGTGGGPPSDRPLSFQYLSENDVATTTITGFGKRHAAYHFTASFRESIQPTAQTGGEDAAEVTDAAVDWLERNAGTEDWLLHVNYWDVHHPYERIEPYVEDVVASGDRPDWPDGAALADHQDMTGTRCGSLWANPGGYRSEGYRTGRYTDWPMPESFDELSDVEDLIDGYDAAIRKVDHSVARLFDVLEAAGVRGETAVVVTGDHGDGLGEHGIYAEHALAHPPCQRVPMVVSWPGVTGGAGGTAVDGQVYQFDLAATLCDLADLSVPSGWDAAPFTAALRGEEFAGRDRLVCSHGIYTFSRAVYEDDWVYIRILHPGVFSLPGLYNDPALPGGGLELLHDRSTDPHMTENLIGEHPEKAADLRATLDAATARWTATDDAVGEDPLVRMAVEDGPFLYVDPEELLALYEELDRPEEQLAAIRRGIDFSPESAR